MGIEIRHEKTATAADGPNAAEVQPSDWNAAHDVALSGSLKAIDALAAPAEQKNVVALSGPASGLLIAISDYVASILAASNESAFRAAIGVDLSDYMQGAQIEAAISEAIADLIGSAPGALDTLNELAAALGDDANFAATMTAALAGKVATSRSLNTSGLASGGGNLTADRTITVPAASQAEAEAGANNAKAMTPLRVAQAIAVHAPAATAGVINETALPPRLRAVSRTITDWNTATEAGFYFTSGSGSGGNVNGPATVHAYVGYVLGSHSDFVTQTVWPSGGGVSNVWRRGRFAGVWGSWHRLYQSESELDARYVLSGGAGGGGQPVPTSDDFAVGSLVLATCGTGSVANGATVAGSALSLVLFGNNEFGYMVALRAGGTGVPLSGTWKNVQGDTLQQWDAADAWNCIGYYVRTA